ncbi:response regulator transcription factor [[Clostridium] scindens]|jgi:DNA-binding response OmpR family regulator|uniref:response regulator transcription factor n=1 Tax=Clostridium scindens (strain JCM 10418 / VPI 12708) TaxID=29347 RepID=UPI0001658D59|nr:response regulator transcription factor [[Clostridium] scindens]MBS6806230.1 response regulator transcription factor [Lachnospiraceae bacterium]MCQ4690007.1 response regulator transcription factor [Clostridium sp. SL.3.18]EDS06183.1 response regulator receiver domain protein [[Clostridium] scindens ATCC 35704]MBO1683562.1 response regulator transcription factor [[Clostridium] scindens]MCB6287065.1 response regulator transcription factor [[Clostridium] scindens]
MRILLVEDDREISEMLEEFLIQEAFEVVPAFDGLEACEKFEDGEFDLVLLDLMIPKMSGMDVMKTIREKSVVPILIVSAKDSLLDKSLGLELGADDYITKPFVMAEVLARIKANLRRTNQYAAGSSRKQEEPATLSCGDIQLNPADFTVRKRGKKIDLTAKEFEILRLLMQNPKKVYTKEQIYSLVWEDAYLGDENAVNVHISRLRNKIEDDARNPEYIITVWGFGYRIGG